MIEKLKLLVESYKVRPPNSNVLVSEIITLFEQFTNETTPQKLVNVGQRVMLNFAEQIYDDLIYDLTDRNGLKQTYLDIDDDIRTEIKSAWIEIINKHLSKISA